MQFIGEFRTAFLDLPLWGRGTIRRMVDEVKTIGRQYVFGQASPTAPRSPLPKGEGLGTG